MINKESTLRDAETLVRFGPNMDLDRAIITLRALNRQQLSAHDCARALRQVIEQRLGDPWSKSILARCL